MLSSTREGQGMSTDTASIQVTPQPAPCGAVVTGLTLANPLDSAQIAAVRAAWLEHQVLAFPDQPMTLEDLERFAATIGPFGEDPFFEGLAEHPSIAQVRRDADETSSLFAESWHSDWSFLPTPPQATVLYGNVIPPMGGDTLFANQYLAWETLPELLKAQLKDAVGIHSARNGYSRQGLYGERDEGRSMAIRYSDDALAIEHHPIAKVHPETGRTALFASPGYTIGIQGMADAPARELLMQVFQHQMRDEHVYRHRWSANMLVLWDNRCINHRATGGYDGHARLLHRITVAAA
jgi:taurine dioxygenase